MLECVLLAPGAVVIDDQMQFTRDSKVGLGLIFDMRGGVGRFSGHFRLHILMLFYTLLDSAIPISSSRAYCNNRQWQTGSTCSSAA